MKLQSTSRLFDDDTKSDNGDGKTKKNFFGLPKVRDIEDDAKSEDYRDHDNKIKNIEEEIEQAKKKLQQDKEK